MRREDIGRRAGGECWSSAFRQRKRSTSKGEKKSANLERQEVNVDASDTPGLSGVASESYPIEPKGREVL